MGPGTTPVIRWEGARLGAYDRMRDAAINQFFDDVLAGDAKCALGSHNHLDRHLDCGAAEDRLDGALDVLPRRAPVRDRDAHRGNAVPDGAAERARAVLLYAADGLAGHLVVVPEPHEDLIQDDVVQHFDSAPAAGSGPPNARMSSS